MCGCHTVQKMPLWGRVLESFRFQNDLASVSEAQEHVVGGHRAVWAALRFQPMRFLHASLLVLPIQEPWVLCSFIRVFFNFSQSRFVAFENYHKPFSSFIKFICAYSPSLYKWCEWESAASLSLHVNWFWCLAYGRLKATNENYQWKIDNLQQRNNESHIKPCKLTQKSKAYSNRLSE